MSIRRRVLRLLDYSEATWEVKEADVDKVAFMEQGFVDSLQMVALIIDLEDEFGIELTPEDTESDEMRTVGGLIAIVEGKVASGETIT